MPQALGAIGIKGVLGRLLKTMGYRGVLVSNTLFLGLLLAAFSTIGLHTPTWYIVVLAFVYGSFSVVAVHQHEHAGLFRYRRPGYVKRQLHCQHHAATGHQFWRGHGGNDDGLLCAREIAQRASGDDCRNPHKAFVPWPALRLWVHSPCFWG